MNNFKPFEEQYFNKKSIANKEDKNVVIRQRIRGRKLNSENLLKEEKNSIKNLQILLEVFILQMIKDQK